MKVLVQRVKEAAVEVEGKRISGIGPGYLLLVAIAAGDAETDVDYMAKKILNLRIFEDEQGKMNRNILQTKGKILSVSQFTLCANMKKGNRPGFDLSAKPALADEFWRAFNEKLRKGGAPVQTGIFGADMQVSLVNDGPVTIWLDSKGP